MAKKINLEKTIENYEINKLGKKRVEDKYLEILENIVNGEISLENYARNFSYKYNLPSDLVDIALKRGKEEKFLNILENIANGKINLEIKAIKFAYPHGLPEDLINIALKRGREEKYLKILEDIANGNFELKKEAFKFAYIYNLPEDLIYDALKVGNNKILTKNYEKSLSFKNIFSNFNDFSFYIYKHMNFLNLTRVHEDMFLDKNPVKKFLNKNKKYLN